MYLCEEQLFSDENYIELNAHPEVALFTSQSEDEVEYSRLLETAELARAGLAWGEQDYLEAE